MRGYRKFTLGLAYIASMVALAGLHILCGNSDLTGLGVFAAGVASGVGVVVWGNVQVARSGKDQP